MAKIVEPPKPKRVKCNKCGAIIEYLPEEIKERSWKDYDGGGNYEEYIPCPRITAGKKKCPGEGIVRSV